LRCGGFGFATNLSFCSLVEIFKIGTHVAKLQAKWVIASQKTGTHNYSVLKISRINNSFCPPFASYTILPVT